MNVPGERAESRKSDICKKKKKKKKKLSYSFMDKKLSRKVRKGRIWKKMSSDFQRLFESSISLR